MKMKKILLMIAICISMMFVGCNGCTKGQEDQVTVDTVECVDTVDTVETARLNVEHIISMDRQTMYNKYNDGEYVWYETEVKFNQFLDEDCDGSIEEVVNIFQRMVNGNPQVYKIQHFADGTVCEDSVIGFWIEDYSLNNDEFKLTFKEAFDKMMATNYPKPHSQYACVRNPIGPKGVNAQYIFGNIHSTLFVDAVTGDVKDSNPAFEGLNMPLGEWP